jgi:membrane-bound lytic murein transglycosylase A
MMIKQIQRSVIFRWLFLGVVFLWCGCLPGKHQERTSQNSMKIVSARHYPQFLDTLDLEGLDTAIAGSLDYFKRVPLDRTFQYGARTFTAAHIIVSLETLEDFLSSQPSAREFNAFIRSRFLVFEAAGNEDNEVLFTGYYEPTYPGSLNRTQTCTYPIYSVPDDLLEIDLAAFSDRYKGHRRLKARVDEEIKRVVPYYSRAQINGLDDFYDRAAPVAWLKNRVDRFFLEIQGSGRVKLEDGREIQVHYAGSNGNSYRSVGRYLIDKKEILKENMSMQAIRAWLEQHPQRMDEVLHHNDSFVFFQEEQDGPKGSLGVKVTAMRSIATDARLFPKGALCFIQTRLPEPETVKSFDEQPLDKWEAASFFVLNQDTGGAIKGAARADLFCGNGSYAEFTAGHKNVYGRLFFLILNPEGS